jgi:Asp-tRNA(Asn)/Glu-tRNA(Gln) amidotransferase A subunit family amidase
MKFRHLIWSVVVVTTVHSGCKDKVKEPAAFSAEHVEHAEQFTGIDFTPAEIDSMMRLLDSYVHAHDTLRHYPLPNEVFPVLDFNPLPTGFEVVRESPRVDWQIPDFTRPQDDVQVAFLSIRELASLIRSRQITSEELTGVYLDRIMRFDDSLQSVITLLRDRAIEKARTADREIQSGQYRGILHGIPFGVKDLLALQGYKTTWGANPYRDQVIDQTATVINRLEDAGAVLIAKLTSGALARGDVWYGGKTKNPWDLSQGASGSSAGSASATAAGLVAFSIGTETLGSIISPSSRCGVTGLRPTYGAVSRYGVMTLAWSLDKIGPIGRSADDCAIIYDVIRGKDELDHTTMSTNFRYDTEIDLSTLKVGYLKYAIENDTTVWGENARESLQVFSNMGIHLDTFALPDDLPYGQVVQIIISAERSAAFDELVASNRDDLLVEQGPGSRATSLRAGHFIPAVAYINANRYRRQLIEAMDDIFQNFDVLVVPRSGTNQSAITNLTGHPALSIPNGFDERGRPTSIVLIGRLFGEADILEIGTRFQELTDFENRRPHAFVR